MQKYRENYVFNKLAFSAIFTSLDLALKLLKSKPKVTQYMNFILNCYFVRTVFKGNSIWTNESKFVTSFHWIVFQFRESNRNHTSTHSRLMHIRCHACIWKMLIDLLLSNCSSPISSSSLFYVQQI